MTLICDRGFGPPLARAAPSIREFPMSVFLCNTLTGSRVSAAADAKAEPVSGTPAQPIARA